MEDTDRPKLSRLYTGQELTAKLRLLQTQYSKRNRAAQRDSLLLKQTSSSDGNSVKKNSKNMHHSKVWHNKLGALITWYYILYNTLDMSDILTK